MTTTPLTTFQTADTTLLDADKLVLFTINNGDIYDDVRRVLEVSLIHKWRRGDYDFFLSVKDWYGVATYGAKAYHEQFGLPGRWFNSWPVKVREEAAVQLAVNFHSQLQAGDHDLD